jgi:uncharacterized protein (DUF2141 family)
MNFFHEAGVGLICFTTLAFQPATFAHKNVSGINLQAKFGIVTIKVQGFRNDKGKAGIALYNSKAGFDKDQAFKEALVDTKSREAVVTFRDVPPGIYAAAAFHDENGNGKLDENSFGIPTEGVGLSNNPKISVTSVPTFEKIKFNLIEGEQTVGFKIQY